MDSDVIKTISVDPTPSTFDFDDTVVIDFNDLAKDSEISSRITIDRSALLDGKSKKNEKESADENNSNCNGSNLEISNNLRGINEEKYNLQVFDNSKIEDCDERIDDIDVDAGDLSKEDIDEELEDKLLREPEETANSLDEVPDNRPSVSDHSPVISADSPIVASRDVPDLENIKENVHILAPQSSPNIGHDSINRESIEEEVDHNCVTEERNIFPTSEFPDDTLLSNERQSSYTLHHNEEINLSSNNVVSADQPTGLIRTDSCFEQNGFSVDIVEKQGAICSPVLNNESVTADKSLFFKYTSNTTFDKEGYMHVQPLHEDQGMVCSENILMAKDTVKPTEDLNSRMVVVKEVVFDLIDKAVKLNAENTPIEDCDVRERAREIMQTPVKNDVAITEITEVPVEVDGEIAGFNLDIINHSAENFENCCDGDSGTPMSECDVTQEESTAEEPLSGFTMTIMCQILELAEHKIENRYKTKSQLDNTHETNPSSRKEIPCNWILDQKDQLKKTNDFVLSLLFDIVEESMKYVEDDNRRTVDQNDKKFVSKLPLITSKFVSGEFSKAGVGETLGGTNDPGKFGHVRDISVNSELVDMTLIEERNRQNVFQEDSVDQSLNKLEHKDSTQSMAHSILVDLISNVVDGIEGIESKRRDTIQNQNNCGHELEDFEVMTFANNESGFDLAREEVFKLELVGKDGEKPSEDSCNNGRCDSQLFLSNNAVSIYEENAKFGCRLGSSYNKLETDENFVHSIIFENPQPTSDICYESVTIFQFMKLLVSELIEKAIDEVRHESVQKLDIEVLNKLDCKEPVNTSEWTSIDNFIDEMLPEDEEKLLEDDLFDENDENIDERDIDEDYLLEERSEKEVPKDADTSGRVAIKESAKVNSQALRQESEETCDEQFISLQSFIQSIFITILDRAVAINLEEQYETSYRENPDVWLWKSPLGEHRSRSIGESIINDIVDRVIGARNTSRKRKLEDEDELNVKLKSFKNDQDWPVESSYEIARCALQEIIDKALGCDKAISLKRNREADDVAGRGKVPRTDAHELSVDSDIVDTVDDFECLTEGDSDEDLIRSNDNDTTDKEFIQEIVDDLFTSTMNHFDKDTIIQDILEDVFLAATKTKHDDFGLMPFVIEATTIDSSEFQKIPIVAEAGVISPDADSSILTNIKMELIEPMVSVKVEPSDYEPQTFDGFDLADIKPLNIAQFMPSGRPRRSVVPPRTVRTPSPVLKIPKRPNARKKDSRIAERTKVKHPKHKPKSKSRSSPKAKKAPKFQRPKTIPNILKKTMEPRPTTKASTISSLTSGKVLASIPMLSFPRKGSIKTTSAAPSTSSSKRTTVSRQSGQKASPSTRSSPSSIPTVSIKSATRPTRQSPAAPLITTVVQTARKKTVAPNRHVPVRSSSSIPAANVVQTARKGTGLKRPRESSSPASSTRSVSPPTKIIHTARKSTSLRRNRLSLSPSPSARSLSPPVRFTSTARKSTGPKRPRDSPSPSLTIISLSPPSKSGSTARKSTGFKRQRPGEAPFPSSSTTSARSESPLPEPTKKLLRGGFLPARKKIVRNIAVKSTTPRPTQVPLSQESLPVPVKVNHDHSYSHSIQKKPLRSPALPTPYLAAVAEVMPKKCHVTLMRNPVIERLLPSRKKEANEPNICELCEPIRVFTSKEGLVKHLKDEHANTLSGTAANDKCAGCDRKYFSPKRLLEHMRTCPAVAALPSTSKLPVADLINKRMEEKQKLASFACQYCDKRFGMQASLNMHMRFFHHSQDDPLGEEEDDQEVEKITSQSTSFASEMVQGLGSGLVMRLRRENTSFQCTKCSAMFLKESDLQDHQLLHNVGYKCRTCPAIFDQKALLIGHELSHTVQIKQERLSPEIEIIEERLGTSTMVPSRLNSLPKHVAKKSTGTRPLPSSSSYKNTYPLEISPPRPTRKKF